jgi:hypothetical protein
MKVVIALAFVGILGALAAAGALMLRGGRSRAEGGAPDRRMARALAVRVGVSVALFLVILLAYLMGWIQPTGLRAGQ